MSYLFVLLMLAGGSGPCARDGSTILDQVATNALRSLSSLHDYVWVVELHQTMRDKKGKVEERDYRYQTIVAHGQMYVRTLHPGEAPEIPEPETTLSSDYHVYPATVGNCGVACVANPYEFLQVDNAPAVWDVLRVQEDELNGAPALVLDLRAKHFPHRAIHDMGTAWVDPAHCRLLRLTTTGAGYNGQKGAEETEEFGEVKGNWLPLKRRIHSFPKGRIVEYTEEYAYTYLKFGASVRIVP